MTFSRLGVLYAFFTMLFLTYDGFIRITPPENRKICIGFRAMGDCRLIISVLKISE